MLCTRSLAATDARRDAAVARPAHGILYIFIYMAQDYPAVLPCHSVARSTDRYEHYCKNTIRPSCFPAGMPWSHPSASTRVAVPPKTRRCRSVDWGRAGVAAVAHHGRAAGPGRPPPPSWVRSCPGRPRSPLGDTVCGGGMASRAPRRLWQVQILVSSLVQPVQVIATECIYSIVE